MGIVNQRRSTQAEPSNPINEPEIRKLTTSDVKYRVQLPEQGSQQFDLERGALFTPVPDSNMRDTVTGNKAVPLERTSDMDAVRHLSVDVYHRGGRLSKKSIESLKKTIDAEVSKLLLKDQFMLMVKKGKATSDVIKFYHAEETRRRTQRESRGLEDLRKRCVEECAVHEGYRLADDVMSHINQVKAAEITNEDSEA